jgi:type IV secretion system protein VirD4
MAEQRPYRSVSGLPSARLIQVKIAALATLIIGLMIINSLVTQHAARLFGYSSALGRPLPGIGLYAPWGWIVWWSRWHAAASLQPVWGICIRQAAPPMLVLAALAFGAIALARQILSRTDPDLHGSARWAATRDVRAAGLISPFSLPRPIRKLVVRAKLLKPPAARMGVYLGVWRRGLRAWYLRDCGPAHVLVFAPTRSGKGVGVVIPTLLTWPQSVIVHDLKGENWALTAGARKRMGQLCLKFDPTDPSGASVKYNPLEQVRLRTVHEAEDVQNIVHMIVDPDGRGLNDHWVKTGAALLTGTILHILYAEPNKTLRGVAGLLSDPRATLADTIERILATKHDPDGAMGWRDYRGEPTRTHPIVAESMRELLNKSENERAGVFSTVMSFLSLYRDPVVAANTERSEFRIDDLVNHKRPVSLYLVIPLSSRDRLRPLVRLILNQIVRALTSTLAYRNGQAVSAHRHRLLLMLDEFPTLGRLDVFAEALSLMAGYGIRSCLIAQDLSQIHAVYGHDEAITTNCDTRVAFTPNRIETARLLSQMTGETTVRHSHRTVSSSGASVSEPEVARPLMTPDEVMRLSAEEALIFTRGHPPARAAKLRYHADENFKRRAKFAAPAKSDVVPAPPLAVKKEERADESGHLGQGEAASPAESNDSKAAETPAFLKHALREEKLV